MDKSNEWINLYAQNKQFYYINGELFQLLDNFRNRPDNLIIQDCSIGLKYGEDRAFTLNLLNYLNENIKEKLFERLMDIYISGAQCDISLAYDVIDSMQYDYVRERIYPFIMKNISKYMKEDEIEDDFQQIIGILQNYQLKEELRHFLTNHCLNSNIAVIREMYDEYIKVIDNVS